jgi:hypothetical protein
MIMNTKNQIYTITNTAYLNVQNPPNSHHNKPKRPNSLRRTIIVLQLRHETHPLTRLRVLPNLNVLTLQHPTRTPRLDMRPQPRQNLAVLPPLRHRPVRRLEPPRRLRPLARVSLVLPENLVERLLAGGLGIAVRRRASISGRHGVGHVGALGFGRGEIGARALGVGDGSGGGFLRGPVVDIPVVFVEEGVELLELGGGHGAEVGVGEGGEEEVAF